MSHSFLHVRICNTARFQREDGEDRPAQGNGSKLTANSLGFFVGLGKRDTGQQLCTNPNLLSLKELSEISYTNDSQSGHCGILGCLGILSRVHAMLVLLDVQTRFTS